MQTAPSLTVLLTATFAAVALNYCFRAQKAGDHGAREPASYTSMRILSYDPFIAYIPDFISLAERHYLMNLTTPLLSRSTVLAANYSHEVSPVRTSSTAYLPLNDTIVAAVAKRAAEFQGYWEVNDVDVQVTSYAENQQYREHYDWYRQPQKHIQRFSTFFAILDASCQYCGTRFPEIKIDWKKRDPRWCEIVDCNARLLTTKNTPGSAFFWRNLHANGTGRMDVLHAGLRARNGTKVGLNIWTTVDLDRYQDASDLLEKNPEDIRKRLGHS